MNVGVPGSTRRSTRCVARATAGLLLGAALVGWVAGPAQADEVYPYPAGVDSVVFDGHGWGHGIGMSQYGAQGAALRGLTWQQILAFYYPGTTLATTFANPAIRVDLTALGTQVALAKAVSGLRVSDGVAEVALPTKTTTGATITRYGIWPASTGLVLRREVSGVWADHPVTGTSAALASPASLANATVGWVDTMVGLGGSARSYRGTLTVHRSSPSALWTVDTLPMDSYLRSVVPSESIASWHANALAAQSVAARTYAADRMRRPSPTYDICDTTQCQVYNGRPAEYPSTDAAVTKTTGAVLTYGGLPITAMYSSTNGGWTVDAGVPYLVAKADPYDGVVAGSRHSWEITVSRARIQGAYPQIGILRQIRVVARDGNGEWGGRVATVSLEGSLGSVTLSGSSFASTLGLYHRWFVPSNSQSDPAWPRDFTGDGVADLLGVALADGSLRVYRGSGTGGWLGWSTVTGVGPDYNRILTVGPWGADLVPDLLATRPDGTLWLLAGAGASSVQPAVQIGHGWSGLDLLLGVGRWDADRFSDILARGLDGRLWLYPGNGAGSFLAARQVGWGWSGLTRVLAAGDVDSDGHPDLLASTSTGALLLYPGSGSGGFLPPRQVGSGWSGFTAIVSVGDFDGTRTSDILARRADGTLWLYPGLGTGRWGTSRQVGSGWNGIEPLVP